MTQERENLIAFVKETHHLASETDVVERSKAAKEVSAKTAKDYTRVAKSRLDISEEDGGKLLDGVSRQSWDHHRAALRNEAAKLFSEHRKACDEAQREAGVAQRAGDVAASAIAIRKATEHAQNARASLNAFRKVTAAQKPEERSAPRQSKRSTLPRNDDWQQRAWEAATPAMRPALICGWIGARPNEIENRVTIARDDEGGQVVVKILGAKITETSGQPQRILVFDRESDIGQKLLSTIPAGKSHVGIERRAKRINLDWSQRIRPRIGGKVSAYSLRHQFAANMKASGMDPIDIARALGHLSIKSQGRYGSKQQGQGGSLGLSKVYAERDIRTGPDADAVIDYAPNEP
jgi:integrase